MQIDFVKELETGVSWQDKQHKELLQRLSEFATAIEEGEGLEKCLGLLNFLDEYVVVHFHEEEQAMHKYRYPDMVEHLELHTEFIDKLASLKERIGEGGSCEALTREIGAHVVDWFRKHIIVKDKVLGRFILSRSSSSVSRTF
ncbi:MAG: hemerythrin family protein [Deltaproteobacteria bacterium]|nr:hemerythrin family protein [Deltaproteobacteria bacterium]